MSTGLESASHRSTPASESESLAAPDVS